jgi:hypothetical protein
LISPRGFQYPAAKRHFASFPALRSSAMLIAVGGYGAMLD